MKKKQLRKFIALFDRLPEAAGILSGKYDTNQTEKDNLSLEGAAYQAIRDIVEDPELKFLTKVFDEIDDNLYEFNSCCDKYIKDLLSGFVWIAPFLEFSPKMEWMNLDNESEDEQNCFPLYIATLSLISQKENLKGREDELSDAEKYILACSSLLQNFAESLDARCLRFDLDFPAIQDELNIYIQTNRDLEKLALSGYMDKVKMLMSKEKAQMALPGAQSQPLSLMQKNPSAELDTTDQNNHLLTLESVFADPYQYNCIMEILVEKKFCQPATLIWIDLKKGYKTFIANLLKYLHFQNYYKNRAGLSNLQIQQIALNTFHVYIALDTIKHAELRDSNLKFIPEASTIKENRLKIASGH